MMYCNYSTKEIKGRAKKGINDDYYHEDCFEILMENDPYFYRAITKMRETSNYDEYVTCDLCKSKEELISIDAEHYSFVICQKCYEAIINNEKLIQEPEEWL